MPESVHFIATSRGFNSTVDDLPEFHKPPTPRMAYFDKHIRTKQLGKL